MFTKIFVSQIMLMVAIYAALMLVVTSAFAGESAYVGSQRFMPLPPPSRMPARAQVVSSPAKFMPLDPSRMPVMRLPARLTIDSKQPSEVPPVPANAKPSNLKNMSATQAQQLLSIYNQSK